MGALGGCRSEESGDFEEVKELEMLLTVTSVARVIMSTSKHSDSTGPLWCG